MELASTKPLLWLLLLLPMAAVYAISLVDRPARLKVASFVLRMLGIVLLVLALCGPYVADRGEEAHVVFLLDVSESVDLDSAISRIPEIDAGIAALNPGDTWSLFAFADGTRSFATTEELKKLLEQWKKGVADDEFRAESRVADALLGVRLAFPSGKSRRIVLLSDGQETGASDDLAGVLDSLAREDVDVRLARVEGLRDAEASVVSVESSTPSAFEGEIVRIETTVAANNAMPARLRLLHRGVAVKEVSVNLEARADNRIALDVPMETAGASVWTAELIPSSDRFPINNQLSTVVEVRGQPRLLFLHREPKELRAMARALEEQDFDVDVRGVNGLPESIPEMLAFDAIVLADVAATELSVRQMQDLRRYVSDFGGGLVMTGSENSFGLGGYYKTPVEEVLPLISRYEKEKEKPSLAMVLVIDKSGSMEGLPIELARQAAKATVELLGPRDRIAVIGFDGDAQVICEMRSAGEASMIQASIDSLAAGGGTNVYPAMEVGRGMLDSSGTQVKHMIILSDGQTQPADHLGLTQAMADSGITVSTVALGEGAARELMTAIAETGRGRYYETVDPNSVPQIFTKETMQATKSAIKEDLFGAVVVGDHPILAGYNEGELPFILGYVMTEAKPTSQVLLAAETGDPLLAVSRFGLGTGMAWSSDLTETWGGEWLAWGDCGKFWAQVFRGVVRKEDVEGLRTKFAPASEKWTVDVFRFDPDRNPVGGINWEASVLDDQGQSRPVHMEETGLGRYRLKIEPGTAKSASLRIHDRDSDKLKILHRTAAYPAEYRLSRELPAALEGLGDYVPAAVREGLKPMSRQSPAAHWFSFAAMTCLFAGILLRRL